MTATNEAHSAATSAAGSATDTAAYAHVACPFCGIHCDDLALTRTGAALSVGNTRCAKAVAGFERALPAASPMIERRQVSLAEAVEAASGLIRKARMPVYGGLATDVEGMRAVMAVADRSCGVVDHALSEAQYRNFNVLQSTGWITTTLTETRNRADVIVILGSDVHAMHPRFFERIVSPPETMFETGARRTVVFIGQGLDKSGAFGPGIGKVVDIACKPSEIGELLGAIRLLLTGGRLDAPDIAGVARSEVAALVELLTQAAYPVFVWAPPSLNFANADLAVLAASQLVKELNVKGRAAGLSLAGNEGAVTAGAVCAWQSGYPLRVSYAAGKPEHDPYRFAASRLIAAKETDLLIWVASISPELAPPETDVPTILLATPGLMPKSQPTVYIPVGTPGVDHAGRIVRCDNVVSLPLRNLGRAALPSVAEVMSAIEKSLG